MPILNMVWWWKKWGNIWEPLNLTVTTSWLDATIKWEDNEIWTIPLTTFQKSELVRKIGSAPTSPSDWDLVVTETVKDTYKVSGYVDQWLTDGETYYYRVFSYSDLGWISYCDAESVTIGAGWTPWVNTVAYYPLDSNTQLSDLSGNNRDLTSFGSTITFWIQNWVDCAYFNDSKANYTEANMLPSTWRTVSFWINYSNFNANTWNGGIWAWGTSYGDYDAWWIKWWCGGAVFIGDGSSNSNLTLQASQRYHILLTQAWTSFKIYLNWTLQTDRTAITWSWSDWNALALWCKWAFPRDWAWQYYYSNVIFEDKVRTAQEISDYFNQTKWDYWIS